jgi:calreticulin
VWKRRIIKNPKYNGTWEAPVVRNPKVTKEAEKKYAFKRIRYIGIDVWNVESGTIYDNIFLVCRMGIILL